jgi:DNA polymerase III epsilon subunit-like protein
MNYLILDTETADILYKSKDYTDEDAKDWGFDSLEEIKIITQLSFTYIKNGEMEFLDTLAKPEIEISLEAMEVTNITNKDVENKSSLEKTDCFKRLKEIVENDDNLTLIGHNIDFDIDAIKRYDLDLSNKEKIDTLQVSKYLSPEADFHRLNYLQYYLDISEEVRKMLKTDLVKNLTKDSISAHNSIYDVIVTLNLYKKYSLYLKRTGLKTIEEIDNRLKEMTTTPFLLEEFPWGYLKGTKISEMSDLDLLKSYKLDIDEMNFKYTMNTEIEKRGGLEKIFKGLGNWHKEKMFRDQLEDISNQELLKVVKNYFNMNQKVIKEKEDINSLSFGKYKNILFDEKENEKFKIPNNYLEWLLENNKNLSEQDKNTIQKVLDFRTGVKKDLDLMDFLSN